MSFIFLDKFFIIKNRTKIVNARIHGVNPSKCIGREHHEKITSAAVSFNSTQNLIELFLICTYIQGVRLISRDTSNMKA